MRLTLKLFILALLVFWTIAPSSTHAQVPWNDDINSATTITALPYDGTSTNVGATTENAEEPAACDYLGPNSIWWSYTPSASGTLLMDSSGSSFDTVLSVWTPQNGSSALEETTCDDWPEAGDKLTVSVDAGTTYYIRVTGYDGAEGMARLQVSPVGTPANDAFANAEVIGALPYTQANGSTLGATMEPSEVAASCTADASNSIWWRYTAPADGAIRMDTLGSMFDTVLSVWTGSGHPLTEVACSDQTGNEDQSSLGVAVEQGTTYFIRVTGYTGKSGTVTLNLTEVVSPANDNRASAVPVSGDSFSGNSNNTNGTVEAGEATVSCATEAQNSIWWSYTPERNGLLTLDTFGSTFDTVLSVWEADADGLAEAACNDNAAGGSTQSQISQEVAEGKTYYIRVAGYGGSTIEPVTNRQNAAPAPQAVGEGAVQLNLGFSPLAVTLGSFNAVAGEGYVMLRWETVSEQDNLGFNLFRSTNPGGSAEQINSALIESQAPGSSAGSSYEWLDQNIDAGVTYYYWLEDVATNGVTTRHGPVSAEYNAPTSITVGALNQANAAPSRVAITVALMGLTMLAIGFLRRKP